MILNTIFALSILLIGIYTIILLLKNSIRLSLNIFTRKIYAVLSLLLFPWITFQVGYSIYLIKKQGNQRELDLRYQYVLLFCLSCLFIIVLYNLYKSNIDLLILLIKYPKGFGTIPKDYYLSILKWLSLYVFSISITYIYTRKKAMVIASIIMHPFIWIPAMAIDWIMNKRSGVNLLQDNASENLVEFYKKANNKLKEGKLIKILSIGIIAIIVFTFIYFGNMYIISNGDKTITLPKRNFSFSNTFTSVEEIVEDYNNTAPWDRTEETKYLVNELRKKGWIISK